MQRVPVRFRLRPARGSARPDPSRPLGRGERGHHQGVPKGKGPRDDRHTRGIVRAWSPRPQARESASLQDWIAVIAGGLGALIASLDISIVNSALPRIQGEIGASGTEGTWISTGYLVSEVVMIPLAAWLTRVLGLRTLLLMCAGSVHAVFNDLRRGP